MLLNFTEEVIFRRNVLKYSVWSGAKVCQCCRNRKLLKMNNTIRYLFAEVGFDTAENDLSEVWFTNLNRSAQLVPLSMVLVSVHARRQDRVQKEGARVQWLLLAHRNLSARSLVKCLLARLFRGWVPMHREQSLAGTAYPKSTLSWIFQFAIVVRSWHCDRGVSIKMS